MATLSARERVLEMGSGRAAGGATGAFEKARQLATMHNQPMLALKAFCAWLHHASTTDSARAFGLLDLSLYCNKFATEQATAADVEIHLRLVRARDYFKLVVDEFEELYQVHMPLSSVAAAAALVDAGSPFALPKSVPVGLVTVLMITLHNWACVEMAVAGDGIQMASKLFAVCHRIEEQLQSSSGLGSSWEAVQNVTSATRAVVKCNFPLAESAARRAVEIVGVSASQAQDNGAAASSVNGDTAFLQAVAFYSLGVATEVSACEDALRSYEEALKRLLQSRSGSLHQAVMEQTRGHLQQYIDAEQSRERMRLAAEEALASAHSDRRGQNASRPRRPQGTARRTARKVSNSRTSISGQSLSAVVAPPVPEPLQQYLAEHGLSTFVCLACSFKGVFDTLGHSLLRSKGDAPLPLSLFAGTRYEASDAESIFAVPLCSTTPLQWTLLLREAANKPSVATRRSVWSPRPTLAPLLSELAAQRPPGPKSASASQTRKEITEGNNKLRQQVLQLFSPPTATSKIKKNAHDSVDAVVQLLGQRLSVLLKTERAFEDHWTATERVASALRSYAVSRDLVHLKKTLLSEQRLRQMRRERSARVIANFFRDVVSQRGPRVEKSASHQQQMAEKERSAIVFQKYTRRWLAVQELRKRAEAQAAYVQKVVLVQSLARRMFARAAYDDLRRVRASQKHLDSEQARQAYAALQIQRVYRGHCARLRCYHLLGMTHEAVLHHLRDSRTYYATLIQKHIRGALVRLQYGKAVYAQRCYGRNVYRRRLWERSCVTIQRAFRAHRLRRANAISSANEATLRVTGSAASRRLLAAAGEGRPFGAAATEIAAAQRIQSAYRCGVAKRRLEALRYARVRDDSSTAISHYSAPSPFVLKDSFF